MKNKIVSLFVLLLVVGSLAPMALAKSDDTRVFDFSSVNSFQLERGETLTLRNGNSITTIELKDIDRKVINQNTPDSVAKYIYNVKVDLYNNIEDLASVKTTEYLSEGESIKFNDMKILFSYVRDNPTSNTQSGLETAIFTVSNVDERNPLDKPLIKPEPYNDNQVKTILEVGKSESIKVGDKEIYVTLEGVKSTIDSTANNLNEGLVAKLKYTKVSLLPVIMPEESVDVKFNENAKLDNLYVKFYNYYEADGEIKATFIFSTTEIKDSNLINNVETTIRPYEQYDDEPRNGGEAKVETAFYKSTQEINSCEGCIVDNKCVPYGIRVKNGESKYCELNGEFTLQKEDGLACENNFECETNTCSSGYCKDLAKQVESNTNVLNKIMSWFGNFFKA